MDKVSIVGIMVEHMSDNGIEIKWTEKVLNHGQMDLDIKVNFKRIKDMVMEHSHGPMVDNIQVKIQ